MNEVRWYATGGVAAFVGLAILLVGGPSWLGTVVVLIGLGAIVFGVYQMRRRSVVLGFEIEDEQIHPVPVLDAPKGTYDLISGMTVRVRNDTPDPVGIRVDTLLYRRTLWGWDQPVEDTARRTLLAPAVVPPRTTRSLIARNRTRLPEEIDELGPRHFVKLVIETAGLGSSVRRAFLTERYELPKAAPAPPEPGPEADDDESPLLPFSGGKAESKAPTSPASTRAKVAVLPVSGGEDIKIHPLRESNDTLEGLIDEINAELEEEDRSVPPEESVPI